MPTVRVLAVLFTLLSLYCLRFLLFVRAETTTLVRVALLLCAAAVLAQRPICAEVAHRPLAIGVAALLAAFVLLLAEHDAHSASDTLNRVVPAYCLLFAFTAGLVRRRRMTDAA